MSDKITQGEHQRLLKRLFFSLMFALFFLYFLEQIGFFIGDLFGFKNFVKSTVSLFTGLGFGWRISR